MKAMTRKSIFLYLCTIIFCLAFDSCQNKPTPDERRANLETKISEKDCKEITNNALQVVLGNLREIIYDNVSHGVEEDIYNSDKDNNYYISVVVSGTAKGVLNGVDSVYSFYLYGRIPENLVDKKDFDDNGYNLSLKQNGNFVYSNKEDINALNKDRIESLKKGEEMRKKDFMIGKTKVRFDGKEGNSLIYTSTRELTPDEIAGAIQNNIKAEGISMIQFYSGSDKYADYVYKTQCIIFVKSSDEIYKVIGESAVRL